MFQRHIRVLDKNKTRSNRVLVGRTILYVHKNAIVIIFLTRYSVRNSYVV